MKDTLTTTDIAGTTTEEREIPITDKRSGERYQEPKEHQESKGHGEALTPLFPPERVGELRSKWHELQVEFVDEPRRSVQHADELVAQVMKNLAQSFSDERSKLEAQWGEGDNVSTEDLRVALQRYRSFFERLLSV